MEKRPSRWIIPAVFAVGCVGLGLLGASGGRARGAPTAPRAPVLVELFTSQGCMSCPPADELLMRLDAEQPVPGALVIPLSEHVEYWNGQWRDPFSSAVFTDRQREYHRALATQALYTPQMIVGGQMQLIGSQQKLAYETIARALTLPTATLSLSRVDPYQEGRVSIGITVSDTAAVGPVHDAELWVAIAEEGLETDVQRGENAFRHLRHGPVVRALQQVATLSEPLASEISAATVVNLDSTWSAERLRVVAFVQERASRRVLGATQLPLPDLVTR